MRDRAVARGFLWAAAVLAVPGAPVAAAQPKGLAVWGSCEPVKEPGRVRCELELRAPQGGRLAWSDVIVVSAPSSARPLRSRVAAAAGVDGVARAALALIASTTGVFSIVVQGRAVVCAGSVASAPCQPATREERIEVRVGG